jgi:uncharacterized protein YcnI
MEALLYIVPALLLLLPLALGRYPGERLRLALVRPRRLARPASLAPPPRPASLIPLPRGGALLASSRAGRAPPFHARRAARRGPCEGKQEKGIPKMRRIAIVFAAGLAMLAPAAAQAHVSLHPNEVPAGSFATLDIRVPNESETANTVKVAVLFPAGFTDVSPEYLPGWTPKVSTTKLAKPVKTDDGLITEGVQEIAWSGGKIPPGQFLSFPISTEIPGKAGQELTFKVLQYYDDGEVARWIGSPSSENPAPSIDVTAAGGVLEDVAGTEAEPPAPGASEASGSGQVVASGISGDFASKGLGIAALVVGALGLLVGGAALLTRRRGGGA